MVHGNRPSLKRFRLRAAHQSASLHFLSVKTGQLLQTAIGFFDALSGNRSDP
jgi:hypothetical protein